MKLGNFLVPELRLEEILTSTLSKIYTMSKTDPIPSKILSDSLGYKYGTEPTFFKKINSMIAYGILEGRGVYNITKLGVDLLYPESSEMDKQLKTKAVMNVELWKRIFEKHGKNPPKDGLWVSIKNITEVEPVTAKEYENRIHSWYMQDVSLISEEYLEQKLNIHEESKDLSSKESNIRSVSQQTVQSPDMETIPFANKYSITLPKGDLRKEWEKLGKYMTLYLEDYEAKIEETKKNTKIEGHDENAPNPES